jgi:hypothetical protein
MTTIPLNALVSALTGRAQEVPSTNYSEQQSLGYNATIIGSIRKDIVQHPNRFLIFETQMGANRFIAEHDSEAHREQTVE